MHNYTNVNAATFFKTFLGSPLVVPSGSAGSLPVVLPSSVPAEKTTSGMVVKGYPKIYMYNTNCINPFLIWKPYAPTTIPVTLSPCRDCRKSRPQLALNDNSKVQSSFAPTGLHRRSTPIAIAGVGLSPSPLQTLSLLHQLLNQLLCTYM